MNETKTTTTASGPRFTHISSPGALLREPIPSELWRTVAGGGAQAAHRARRPL
jgi:hypothetical protein